MPRISIGSRKRLIASDMRHRITVKRATTALDTSRQPIVTWVNRYVGEPAKFEQVAGGEIVRGRQIEASVRAIFTVNYRPDYSVQDRIVFQSENYGIVRIHKPDGVGRFLELEVN